MLCWTVEPECFVCVWLTVEMATLTRQNGKTVIKVLPDSVVEGYIKVHEAEEAKAEAEKKKEQEKKK